VYSDPTVFLHGCPIQGASPVPTTMCLGCPEDHEGSGSTGRVDQLSYHLKWKVLQDLKNPKGNQPIPRKPHTLTFNI